MHLQPTRLAKPHQRSVPGARLPATTPAFNPNTRQGELGSIVFACGIPPQFAHLDEDMPQPPKSTILSALRQHLSHQLLQKWTHVATGI